VALGLGYLTTADQRTASQEGDRRAGWQSEARQGIRAKPAGKPPSAASDGFANRGSAVPVDEQPRQGPASCARWWTTAAIWRGRGSDADAFWPDFGF